MILSDQVVTQAVFELRKVLKQNSQQYNNYIITVPKRGYQFIASVERSAPLSSSEQPVMAEVVENEMEPTLAFTTTAEEVVTEMTESEPVAKIPEAKAEVEPKATTNVAANKNSNKWTSFSALLIAIIMPILVITFTNPAESEFLTLAEVDGVKVQTPINHPDLSSWLPAIEKCVVHYNNNHTGMLKPTEVIATGGQTNNLALNYIHPQEYSSENITLRIYANQSDLNDICKGDQ